MLDFFRRLFSLDHPIRVMWHFFQAFIAHWVYGRPGRKMVIIGVTGTKGKTTTVNLVARGLIESGHRVFAFSTATWHLDGVWRTNETKMTSPPPFLLQKLLRKAENAGCTHAVLEASSHSIFYHRDYGVAYDTVVFTNLSRDHLDLHRTMDRYADTKKRLFEGLVYYPRKKGVKKIGIVNIDDAYAERFLSVTADALITFGRQATAEVHTTHIESRSDGTDISIRIPSNEFTIRTKLIGHFNVYNILAAVATLIAQKVGIEHITRSIEQAPGVPGRLEYIENSRGIRCFVDYAHTEGSLASVLETLRALPGRGRIITVFGATGERDRGKRPSMGKILDRLSDVIILTDDDTYGESSRRIISEVRGGISRELGESFWIVANREDAIRTALMIARPDDIVLVAGKGSETVQVTNR